jgi:hypothetical protein
LKKKSEYVILSGVGMMRRASLEKVLLKEKHIMKTARHASQRRSAKHNYNYISELLKF